MKFKFLKLSFISVLVASVLFSSCKKKDDSSNNNNNGGNNGPTYVELSGSLSTQTLDASKKYLLKGTVFVDNGVVLTIPAGTVIFGEKKSKGTLVVKMGGKLMAEGTESKPIIFTSNQDPGEREQGDWGGVILLGKANVNQNSPAIEGITPGVTYGTFQSSSNDNDNSGVVKYVRIEYAGIALTPNNETNGLTFGGVGNGTTIDYVQSSYGGDDAFEWFGGTVYVSHLVAFAAWDDDFDNDFGFSGRGQFCLSVRDPFQADQSGSNGFEVDNDASGDNATPKTAAVWSNVTILGPNYDSVKATMSGNYLHAMHLRRNCEVSIFNSVIAGFPIGLNLDGTLANYTGGAGVLDKNILICPAVKGKVMRPFFNGSSASTPVADYFLTAKSNTLFAASVPQSGSPVYAKAFEDAGIPVNLIMGYNTVAGPTTSNYPADPNFASFTGATQTGAAFTDGKLASGFTSTTYRGAFGSTDWTDHWSTFAPQNIAY